MKATRASMQLRNWLTKIFNPQKADLNRREELSQTAETTIESCRKLRWKSLMCEEPLFHQIASAFLGYYVVYRGANGNVYAAYYPLPSNEWKLQREIFFESGHSTVDIDTLKAHCQEHYDTLSMIHDVDRSL